MVVKAAASIAGWNVVMANPPVAEDRHRWFEERGNESRIKAKTDVGTDANGVEG
jgi:hypothetical protein